MSTKEKDTTGMVCPLSMGRESGSRACDGKGCMAWRWRKTGYEKSNKSENEGFCGMVRSPIK